MKRLAGTNDDGRNPDPGAVARNAYFASKSSRQRLEILVGADDDWTSPAPCRALARKFPGEITLVVYPKAWHDFGPPRPSGESPAGLATPPSGTGASHAGTNEAARMDASHRVPAFIAANHS